MKSRPPTFASMSLGSADWSHAVNGTANRHFKRDLTANSGPTITFLLSGDGANLS